MNVHVAYHETMISNMDRNTKEVLVVCLRVMDGEKIKGPTSMIQVAH